MAVKIKHSAALSTLSLTPLIDVVFLLLIFFLVATRFAEEDREMELPLPEASEAMPLTMAPKEMFINITEAGEYFVGLQKVDERELEQILRRALADNPHQTVTISADRKVAFQQVVTAGNLCNRVGIEYMTRIDGNQ
jgi:biopolymer transport protein ExbD